MTFIKNVNMYREKTKTKLNYSVGKQLFTDHCNLPGLKLTFR